MIKLSQTLIWLFFINMVMLLKGINEQDVTHFPQMNPQESGFYSPSLKMVIAKNCKSSRKTIQFCYIMYHVWAVGVWGWEEIVKFVWEGKAEMLNIREDKLLFTPFCKLWSAS